jgi:hypothetical protein
MQFYLGRPFTWMTNALYGTTHPLALQFLHSSNVFSALPCSRGRPLHPTYANIVENIVTWDIRVKCKQSKPPKCSKKQRQIGYFLDHKLQLDKQRSGKYILQQIKCVPVHILPWRSQGDPFWSQYPDQRWFYQVKAPTIMVSDVLMPLQTQVFSNHKLSSTKL